MAAFFCDPESKVCIAFAVDYHEQKDTVVPAKAAVVFAGLIALDLGSEKF
ncbi:hypothetical protein BH10ACI3_BH10ACI3_26860 [soil metagenome]